MPTPFEEFKSWYSDVIRSLYANESAGFVILVSTFPLLERYTRQKLGLAAHDRLEKPFYDELANLLPELETRHHAREFWGVYRNGLLHVLTFSSKTRNGRKLPAAACTSDDLPLSVTITHGGCFFLNPRMFAERVLKIIENDFKTFEISTITFPQVYDKMPVVINLGRLASPETVTGTALPQTFFEE